MKLELGAHARRMICAALVGTAVIVAGGAAQAQSQAQEVVDLTIDFARLMKLNEPADTIVIGNPGIADATVEDDSMIVLTGKAAGVTNLIVLNDEGEEIKRARLRVSSDVQQLTTVFKAGQRQTFSCSPVCEQVISVGDTPAAFDEAAKQIQGRAAFTAGQ